ncbi:MAG TPA: indole-3-glycerol phosphate synthase TrpC [Candidatus Dormibacteraeota bacterium]|nr:indole-3-glycerol phosphate synthase TrpC [Candidatus Dormibacteraeota bacterium]
MPDVLEPIFASALERFAAAERSESYATVRERALARMGERRGFLGALRAADGCAIVAEIKRASPSAGLIARNFDAAAIARSYDDADAISVLTEPDHFLGDLAFVDVARAASRRPILRKDFLGSRYAIAQSAAHGADCVLLIVAALDDRMLAACMDEVSAYAMDALVEVHDEAELERAVRSGARVVGVNNRNLRTLTTDLATSELLLPQVPREVFAISESGMQHAEDLLRLRQAGARGFLIGEALMRAESPGERIASLKAALRADVR